MNINAVNSTIKSVQKISFKTDNNLTNGSNQPIHDEFVSEQNAPKQKKKKNIWTSVAIGALIIALITDIVVEHQIRVDEKAKKEAIKKEKKLAEELKKELEEKAKKLEEEIKKQKEALEEANKKGKSDIGSDIPEVSVEPPES